MTVSRIAVMPLFKRVGVVENLKIVFNSPLTLPSPARGEGF